MRLFFKHNKGYIFVYFISLIITISYICIKGFIPMGEVLYILIMNSFILICFLIYKYCKNKGLYKLLEGGVDSLEACIGNLGAGDISEDISKILKNQYDLYLLQLQKYNKRYKEHLEFINLWVHQMKTPLSVMVLQIKEFEGEKACEEIQEEINKLNKGLNLALYYSRIDVFEKDFLIEKIELEELVKNVVNDNKRLFIKNRIVPKINIDKSVKVYSDAKWLKFVLEQLITNGVKYSRYKGKELIIQAMQDRKEIKLSVEDKGIGITKQDIKRVFDKFFTGENGRRFGESTGMGLYISKKVCDKLGHKIEIKSNLNEGTIVNINFNNNVEIDNE